MNGLTFSSEGPIMDGTWYNPHTGDSFTVRDSFFEDNQYVVMTTDGRLMKYEQIQNYIKSDKPIQMEKPTTTPKQDVLPAEVAGLLEDVNYDDMIMADDLAMIQGNTLGNLYTKNPGMLETTPMQVVQGTPQPINTNYDIISKALSKRTLPEFQVSIDWTACPVKEIVMLMDLMDVQEQEIVDWYLSQVDVQTTTLMIKEVIKDYIYRQLHEPVIVPPEESVEEIKPEPVVTIEKPTKKATKKTKK